MRHFSPWHHVQVFFWMYFGECLLKSDESLKNSTWTVNIYDEVTKCFCPQTAFIVSQTYDYRTVTRFISESHRGSQEHWIKKSLWVMLESNDKLPILPLKEFQNTSINTFIFHKRQGWPLVKVVVLTAFSKMKNKLPFNLKLDSLRS